MINMDNVYDVKDEATELMNLIWSVIDEIYGDYVDEKTKTLYNNSTNLIVELSKSVNDIETKLDKLLDLYTK